MDKKPKKKAKTLKLKEKEEFASKLKKKIELFLKLNSDIPLSQAALIKQLNLTDEEASLAKKMITELLCQGLIQVEKKKIFLKKPDRDVAVGTLRQHARGFGFVVPNDPIKYPQDIFIPKHLTDSAIDGDIVEVAIDSGLHSEKGPEGAIVSIIKRGHSHLAGTIAFIGKSIHVYVPLLGSQKLITLLSPEEKRLKIGDRIIMKIIDWGKKGQEPTGEFVQYMGTIADPSIDVHAAIEEFDLKNTFSKMAVDEAKAFGAEVSKKELKNRLDLSALECFTIDPETAKDFDDALSLSKGEDEVFHLGVHIADVAHYIPHGSALDKEAMLRCNSTYFPGSCLPMLPEQLSNHLCSLKPDVLRLCISVLIDIDKKGNLIGYKIARSYIKSKKRFTYEEAKEIIDGKTSSPHKQTLLLMVKLCSLLKNKRDERGSFDFSLPELVLQVDDKGEPLGFRVVEYDVSHQLVEEFMLKANEVVARSLNDAGKTLLYRIHEEPSEENLENFFSLARSLGFPIKDKPSSSDLKQLFEKAKNSPYSHQIIVGFIRSMKLAYYSPENVGHYGLALEHYCHFTSPIRRYPDLVIQRLLFNEQPQDINLQLIAEQCSERERISFKAEMSVKNLKKLRLLAKYFKENPKKVYEGVIVKVKPFGIFFELPSFQVEGFLHISELENDYFLYQETSQSLVGEHTGKTHKMGQTLKIQLQKIDLIFGEAKWTLVLPSKKPARKSSKKKRRS